MHLEALSANHAIALADILSNDEKLFQAMGGNGAPQEVSPGDYLSALQAWSARSQAEVYAILDYGHVLGVISFEPKDSKALNIGGWVKSDAWNQGIFTRAMEQIQPIALSKGYKFLTANLPKASPACIAVWKKFPIILRDGRHYVHPWMQISEL